MISNQSNFLGENLKKIDDPGKKSTKKVHHMEHKMATTVR